MVARKLSKKVIAFVCVTLLNVPDLTGCGSTREHAQQGTEFVRKQTAIIPHSNMSQSVTNKAKSSALHPEIYGPPLPSPEVLGAIHSNFDLQSAPQEIPILMYHSISDHPSNMLCVAPDRFAAEMKHLYNARYHTIGFDDLKSAWLNNQKLPRKPILITFDDGYEDNYQVAYPILKRYSLRATIFMITGSVGQRNKLSWDTIRFMDQQRLVQFGSHTVNHLDLRQLNESQQRYEIQQSKADLEHHLGHPAISFCFPSGHYNATTLHLLQQSGYKFAVTTSPGYANLKSQGQWLLHRVRVNGDESIATFSSLFP